jgi:hypothetical protein
VTVKYFKLVLSHFLTSSHLPEFQKARIQGPRILSITGQKYDLFQTNCLQFVEYYTFEIAYIMQLSLICKLFTGLEMDFRYFWPLELQCPLPSHLMTFMIIIFMNLFIISILSCCFLFLKFIINLFLFSVYQFQNQESRNNKKNMKNSILMLD